MGKNIEPALTSFISIAAVKDRNDSVTVKIKKKVHISDGESE